MWRRMALKESKTPSWVSLYFIRKAKQAPKVSFSLNNGEVRECLEKDKPTIKATLWDEMTRAISKAKQADQHYGKKTGYRESVGLFIPLPRDLARQFPSLLPDDRSPSHSTFLYIGHLPEEQDETFLRIINEVFSEKQPRVKAKLDGLEHFKHVDKDRSVAHIKVRYSQSMSEIREKLWERLKEAGIDVGDSFRIYRPHVTLKYMPGMDSLWEGPVPEGSWEFDEIEVWGLPKAHRVKFTPN